MNDNSIAFLIILEEGDLEEKCVLFVESLREFGGRFRDSEVWAIQPRDKGLVSWGTVDELVSKDTYFLRANINKSENIIEEEERGREKGFLNKVYSSAFLEGKLEGRVDTLVLIDSDTLILNEPELLHLNSDKIIAVAPSHGKSIGTEVGENFSRYWKKIYNIAGVDTSQVWAVSPPLHEGSIFAYFNSGVVACRPESGVFREWRNLVNEIVEDEEMVKNMEEMEFFHLDQSTLAATILSSLKPSEVRELPVSYNYPLHRNLRIDKKLRVESIGDVVIPHYHWVFANNDWWGTIKVEKKYKNWLEKRLPLNKDPITALNIAKSIYGKIRSFIYK